MSAETPPPPPGKTHWAVHALAGIGLLGIVGLIAIAIVIIVAAVVSRPREYQPAKVAGNDRKVTFTVPTIQSANRIVFLVAGESKAEAVARAFGSGEPTPDVPASLTRLAPIPVEVFLDEAAASKIGA